MAIADLETTMTDEGFARQECLDERILLVAPQLGYWKGQYHIKDAVVTVGGHAPASKSVTKPQAKLFEGSDWLVEWKKRFESLDHDRNKITNKYGRAFSLPGIRIIPRKVAPAFFRELIGKMHRGVPVYDSDRDEQSVAYRLAQVADSFCNRYWDVIEEMRKHTDEAVWRDVVDRIPSQERMRSKFYVDITPIELVGAGSKKIRREDIDEFQDLIRESTMRRVEEAIEEMITGPRQALAQALEDLGGLIMRDGRVSTKSFNPIRTAIEQIRMFDFVGNDRLLKQIEALENRMGQTVPSTLDSATATSNGFLQVIEAVRATAVDKIQQAEEIEEFGKNFRGLSFS